MKSLGTYVWYNHDCSYMITHDEELPHELYLILLINDVKNILLIFSRTQGKTLELYFWQILEIENVFIKKFMYSTSK